MATFLIERNLPGASDLTPEQLRDIAATSVAAEFGPETANS
ncbi:hypothetical protein [Pseudonocardia charpentierae]|uniref:Uncharacterized protein n=1 Tax=Pseudonocardia charpentierae TaxID=3075545 RepID=A0ABU2NBD7_9PSEU|nr:hypothetical protein [Pseudonocardia sp. DSM 45834]MDT0349974.1 hypothetical protein [Pseudonocardia sp. DSM 45834]